MKKLCFAFCALFLLPFTASAAGISYDTSLQQGFNFQRGVYARVGQIRSLVINGVALAPDISVIDPISQASYAVVGITQQYQWYGNVSDPMNFSFDVSASNRARLLALLGGNLAGVPVSFTYQIFDVVSGPYWVGMSTPNVLQGHFQLDGNGHARLAVASSPNPSVPNPLNYAVTMSLLPSALTQSVTFAPSPGMNVVKRWGAMAQ
jgi:hypothetical protein